MEKKKEELWEALQEQDTDTVKHILCHGVKVNCKLTDNHITPLHYCAQVGDENLFKWLLSKGASVKKRDRWMDTVLHYACKYNQVSTFEVMVSIFQKSTLCKYLKVQGKDKHTPIMWVIKNRNFDIFKCVIKAGVLVLSAKFRSQVIENIVSIASEKDQVAFMELLFGSDKMSLFNEISKRKLDQHENPEFYFTMQNIIQNLCQDDKEKCLENVVSTRNTSVLKLLLDNQIGYSVKLIKASVSVAITQKHFKIAEMLIDAGPDAEYEEEHFIICVEQGNSHLLKKMLCVTRTFPFWSEESQQKIMYAAVREGSEESVRLLGNTLGKDFVKSCSEALEMALKRKSLALYSYFKEEGLKLSNRREAHLSYKRHSIGYSHCIKKHPMVLAVETGQLEFVNMLISDNAIPETREDCIEVIKMAIEKQNEKIVDVLLPVMEEGILNLDDSISVKAVMTANVAFVKILIQRGLKLESKCKRSHIAKTPLHAAVQTGVYEMVELCCQAGAVITMEGIEIKEAIKMNCLDILQDLLKFRGREVFEHISQDIRQWSPLHEAVNEGNKEAVKIILDCDSSVDFISQILKKRGTSLVYIAVEKKSSDIVNLLLQQGAEIKEPDYLLRHCFPHSSYCSKSVFDLLLCASKLGDPAVVSLLIKHGAKINRDDFERFCRETDITDIDIWKEIVSLFPQTDTSLGQLSDILYKACCANNSGYIQAISQNQNFMFPSKIALERCIFQTIANENIECLELLLNVSIIHVNERGLLNNDEDYEANIRLLHTAARKSTKFWKLLIAYGADPYVSTEKGMLPIHFAVMNKNTDLTAFFFEREKILTSKGLKNKLQVSTGSLKGSLLHMAMKLEDTATVKLILNQTEYDFVNAVDSDLKTPLFYIAKWVDVDFVKTKDVLKMFIDNGADINHLDKSGNSTLVEAFQEENTSVIFILLKSGIAESNVQSLKWNLVEKYIKKCHNGVIRNLLSCGYNLSLQIRQNNFSMKELLPKLTPSKPREDNMVAMIKCLLTNGAQLKDYIPLEECVRNNWKKLAKLLIDNRSQANDPVIAQSCLRVSVLSEDESNLLDMALQGKYFKMAKLLLDAGVTFNSSKIIFQIVKAICFVLYHFEDMDVVYCEKKDKLCYIKRKEIYGILDEVIEKGADVDAMDEKGHTALHLATIANLVWVVEKLTQNNCNLDTTSGSRTRYPNLTALQIACKVGNFEIAEMLIQSGALCVFANVEMTLIHFIAEKKFSIAELAKETIGFKNCLDIEYSEDGSGFKCFNLEGDGNKESKLLMQLVNKAIDIDAISSKGRTALHIAVLNDNIALTKSLISLHCNIEETIKPKSPLKHDKSFECFRAVQIAAKQGFIGVVHYLLQRGCDVKMKDAKGKTILHDVIENCHDRNEQLYSCIEKIKEAGIDINAKDNDGQTALNCAIRQNDHKMVELLLRYQVDLTKEKRSSFLLAAKGHKFKIMNSLIEYGVTVNLFDSNRDTALHHLCKIMHSRNHQCFPNCNSSETISLLLCKGANISARNTNNEEPITIACEHGNLEALKILVRHRNDMKLISSNEKSYIHAIHQSYKERYTMSRILLMGMPKQSLAKVSNEYLAFMIKRKHADYDIIKLLLRMGASPNHVSKDNNTLLHVACKVRTNINVLWLLLSFESNVNLTNIKNETPLHVACNNDKREAMELLLKCGAKTDAQDINGWTPLHICVHRSNINGIELLLKYKGNVDLETSNSFERVAKNSTPLKLCLDSNNRHTKGIAKMLIDNGANPNVTDKNGNSILLLALERDYGLSYIRYLTQQRVDINCQNSKGWSALHHAVSKKSIDIMELLLSQHCDVNNQMNYLGFHHWGQTALHIAFKMCHLEMLELLLRNGANIFLKERTGKTPVECLDTSQIFKVDTIKCIILAIRAGGHIKEINGKKYFGITKNQEQLTDMLIQSGCKITFNDRGLVQEMDEIDSVVSKQQVPLTLMRLAANVVRTNLRPNALHSAKHLPLPESIIKFVTLENVNFEVQLSDKECLKKFEADLLAQAQLCFARASTSFGLSTDFDYYNGYEYFDYDCYNYYYHLQDSD